MTNAQKNRKIIFTQKSWFYQNIRDSSKNHVYFTTTQNLGKWEFLFKITDFKLENDRFNRKMVFYADSARVKNNFMSQKWRLLSKLMIKMIILL